MLNNECPYSGDGVERKILYEFYDQIVISMKVITDFYKKFSIEYVRRELRDFLDAGVGYDGTYPENFTPWMALMTYEYVLCFNEAGYQIYQQTI